MEGQLESVASMWSTDKPCLRSCSDRMRRSGVVSRVDAEILAALDVNFSCPVTRRLRLVKWMKPVVGRELNTDGSCRGNLGNMGGGGVIQDSDGGFLAAFSNCFGFGTNNESKIRALTEGVKLCLRLGFLHVDIECDSRIVVNWIQN